MRKRPNFSVFNVVVRHIWFISGSSKIPLVMSTDSKSIVLDQDPPPDPEQSTHQDIWLILMHFKVSLIISAHHFCKCVLTREKTIAKFGVLPPPIRQKRATVGSAPTGVSPTGVCLRDSLQVKPRVQKQPWTSLLAYITLSFFELDYANVFFFFNHYFAEWYCRLYPGWGVCE